MASRYHEVYEGWQRDPEGFWAEAAKGIDWTRPFDAVFDANAGVYGRWYRRRRVQHLLEHRRPPRRGRPGGAAGADP